MSLKVYLPIRGLLSSRGEKDAIAASDFTKYLSVYNRLPPR
jgi:hypothetical protein